MCFVKDTQNATFIMVWTTQQFHPYQTLWHPRSSFGDLPSNRDHPAHDLAPSSTKWLMHPIDQQQTNIANLFNEHQLLVEDK